MCPEPLDLPGWLLEPVMYPDPLPDTRGVRGRADSCCVITLCHPTWDEGAGLHLLPQH